MVAKGPAPSFTFSVTVQAGAPPHPLSGERRAKKATPRDATTFFKVDLADGQTTDVLPTWQHLTFTTIEAGTAATVNANGDLALNVSGTAYVELDQDVQMDSATAPYNIYYMWEWNNKQVYIGSVTIPDNQAYVVTIYGIISLGGSPLGLYVATNTAAHTFYYYDQLFKLISPQALFPAFVPFFPPPPVGADKPIPTFPPPTPPPIGMVPVGDFARIAIQSGPVGVSVAGIIQPVIITGHNIVWPGFSTTFPNPPITVSNVWTIPTLAGGVWTTHLPPSIVTTANITLNGWGLPGPQGGSGPPTYPNPPGAGLPHLAEAGVATHRGSTASGSTGETSIFAHNGEVEEHERHPRRRGRPRRV